MLVIFRTQMWNRLNLHFHETPEILLSLSDGGQMYINDVAYPIRKGSLFAIRSTDFHRSVGNNEDGPYRFCAIHFDPDEIRGVSTKNFDLMACFTEHKNFRRSCHLSEEQLEDMLNRMRRLRCYLRPDCPAYAKDVLRKICLAEILIKLNYLLASSNNDREELRGVQKLPEKIFPIIQYIQEHYAEDLSLDSIAEVFYLSKSHLSRTFKKVTGVTLNAYIGTVRIFKAKSLLRAGYSVNIAGELVGYKSTSYFISLFTKSEGMSPKQYAKAAAFATEFKWYTTEQQNDDIKEEVCDADIAGRTALISPPCNA